MEDQSFRDGVFLAVFNNENGKLALNWLEKLFKITNPDTTNPNEVYLKLGKQAAINLINNIVEGAKKNE